jgi:hypothetical protein
VEGGISDSLNSQQRNRSVLIINEYFITVIGNQGYSKRPKNKAKLHILIAVPNLAPSMFHLLPFVTRLPSKEVDTPFSSPQQVCTA